MQYLCRIALALTSLTGPVFAGPLGTIIELNFSGLQPGEQVLNFYNGGLGGNGSGPGFNYGISFTPGLAASSTSLGFGESAILTAPGVTMTLAQPLAPQGFFLSFYFAGGGSIALFSGPTGTGTQVRSASVGPSEPFGLALDVEFQSIVFSGQNLRLDSITIGNDLVLPEPANGPLVGAFLLATVAILGAIRLSGSRAEPSPAREKRR